MFSLSLSLQHFLCSTSPPATRLFFPTVSTFTDHPGPVDENVPLRRSNIGAAPETLKAAYPSLAGPLYAGDFDDFVGIGAPLLLDRLVIAGRASCRTPSRRASVGADVHSAGGSGGLVRPRAAHASPVLWQRPRKTRPRGHARSHTSPGRTALRASGCGPCGAAGRARGSR
ncbi:hypothetical protein EDB89DRAFT_565951 [Lactarius sanguifluus]|nr:hypothetical protein EDB89DRAFT_565951 [Lactarius sanguifluus]